MDTEFHNSLADTTICYEPTLRLLICKAHGFGIHPTPQAVTRHLRGIGHRCKGTVLRNAISDFERLPLRSLDELKSQNPGLDVQPLESPIPYLKVLDGWCCVSCNGTYLTTSFELLQRHCVGIHGSTRKNDTLWAVCALQTFFKETKHRTYFRVRSRNASKAGSADLRAGHDTSSTNSQDDRGVASQILLSSAENHQLPHSRSLTPALRLRHPFTSIARRHVQWLSEHYLDSLFKSASYRRASEPLFDPSHVDSASSMEAVFPHCHDDPLFFNALLYSMVRSAGRGMSSGQAAVLQQAVITLLNDRLSDLTSLHLAPLIGAILILKIAAYKSQDYSSHEIHSRGLIAVIGYCGTDNLTLAAKRALFWQDTYAAVFLDCTRHIDATGWFDSIFWLRTTQPDISTMLLPKGFARYRDILPVGLLECVLDLVELNNMLPMLASLPYSKRCSRLDSMQASIESRLLIHAQICRRTDALAEATRLGIFLCCYCSWMEVWNDNFIPSTMAEQLLEILETTLIAKDFAERLDLLLWLILVVCTVAKPDQGSAKDLNWRRRQLLRTVHRAVEMCDAAYKENALQAALQDFVYCHQWLMKRLSVKNWHDLDGCTGYRSS